MTQNTTQNTNEAQPVAIDGVAVTRVIKGIAIINIVHLIDHLYGAEWFMMGNDEMYAGVDAWTSRNNGSSYSTGRDQFSEWEAADKAIKEGTRLVVVEDLS